MRRVPSLSLLVVLGLVLAACPKKEAAPHEDLLALFKNRLAEREKKLNAFQLEGTVTQPSVQAPVDGGPRGQDVAHFSAAYRAPARMKGTVRVGDAQQTYVFDGDRLAQVDPQRKHVIEYALTGPKDQIALQLTQIFGSLIPEGYRAPVLDLRNATVKRTTHAKAEEAVELSSVARDEAGTQVRVSYLYRWPSLDLLEKHLTGPGVQMTLEVTQEHCDPKLKLCVPTALRQTYGGKLASEVSVSEVELHAPLPTDAFTVQVPEGYALKKQGLEGG